MKAIQIPRTGGPEVMEWTDVDDPVAEPDQVVVDVDAAGVNFIDTYHRTGLYPMELPIVPGLEGAGTVLAVGDATDGIAVGDRVAWTGGLGSYAERVAVGADAVVPVPDSVPSDIAAASMLQGLTAHYLATDTFPLNAGARCLIHAGAGGVGLLLIQLAKMRGAEVFTTVGSEEKAELARAAGADHVILYREVDFGDAIEDIAGPNALDVVYDGVGKSVFDRSLELLRMRGMMVQFGNASGPVDPVSPLRLSRGGSLFLTRPTLFHYIATRPELLRRATDLFGWIESGELDVRIGARFPMEDAVEAHRALEGRRTTGKVLLVPPAALE
jgi:NADPH:quinone reductase